ncbi:hypothetical protein [Sphingobacterium kitahiroshimense]|uniref:hypothetical protein n=1 Tax=Sphingobacterium kitahiroshimense TaxID=470446 RepID=UPI00320B563F
MQEVIIKLVNILEEKFFVPLKTDGENILMKRTDIEMIVNIYWDKEKNWESLNLIEALEYLKIPSFINDSFQAVYILKSKVSF